MKQPQNIPANEKWLWENPEALALVEQGLQEAYEGILVEGPDLDVLTDL